MCGRVYRFSGEAGAGVHRGIGDRKLEVGMRNVEFVGVKIATDTRRLFRLDRFEGLDGRDGR